MKNLFLVFIALTGLTLASCSKSKEATPQTAQPIDSTFNLTAATLVKQGSFAGNSGYAVSGNVGVYTYLGSTYLYFSNFSSSNGPDLRVYLATDNAATQFISLGLLQAVSGTQLYRITGMPDFNQYDKVLIWCQQFSALFGNATLQ